MSVRQASRKPNPLAAEERKTIIRFDETNAPASVFTYNKTWQKHLEGKLGLKVEWHNSKGGKEYSIPKSRIFLPRAPRKVSEATKTRLREINPHKRPQEGRRQTAESVLSGVLGA